MGIWQVMVMVLLLPSVLYGQLAEKSLVWVPLKVVESVFPRDIGMLDSEREAYAGHLVALAVQRLRGPRANAQTVSQARRMIALALHLSPRNKRGIVVNFQLGKGILPEAIPTDLEAPSVARLLVARGQLLEKVPGKENRQLARYMFHLAAELDPKSEDAVYLSELRRLEQGEPDWLVLTTPQELPVNKP